MTSVYRPGTKNQDDLWVDESNKLFWASRYSDYAYRSSRGKQMLNGIEPVENAPGFDKDGFHVDGHSAIRLMKNANKDQDGNPRERVLAVGFQGSVSDDGFFDFREDIAGARTKKGVLAKLAYAAKTVDDTLVKTAQDFRAAPAEHAYAMVGETFDGKTKLGRAGNATLTAGVAGAGYVLSLAAEYSPGMRAYMAATIGSAVAGMANRDEKSGISPMTHYANMKPGVSAALEYVLKHEKEYDKIVLSGHSLGGFLAGRFGADLVDAIKERVKDPKEVARILKKTELATYNAIGFDEVSYVKLQELADRKDFRKTGDISEKAMEANGYKTLGKDTYVLSESLYRTQTQPGSALDAGPRHSSANGVTDANTAFAKAIRVASSDKPDVVSPHTQMGQDPSLRNITPQEFMENFRKSRSDLEKMEGRHDARKGMTRATV